MPLKKKKYIYISEIRKIFLEQSKKLALFVHINHMNIFELNNLKAYCLKFDIYQTSWKLNLLKKMTKNSIFLSLLKGPTRVFFFNSIETMLEFVNLFSSKKKIIPLAIYWQSNFYNYEFFSKYIKNLHNNLIGETDKNLKTNLIFSLTKTNSSLIIHLKDPFSKFLNILELIKNKKNNNI